MKDFPIYVGKVPTPVFEDDVPFKSSCSNDKGSRKKLKIVGGFGNNKATGSFVDQAHEASESMELAVGGFSDGTDGNTGADQTQWKSSSECMLSSDNNEKVHTPTTDGEANATSGSVSGFQFELSAKDERQLKRERRKQANRESARRSRMRKQAENEELIVTYESLNVENMALKSEINQLKENSEKVRCENASLMEKLEKTETGQVGERVPEKIDAGLSRANSNLKKLLRVKTSKQKECDTQEKSNSESKLHQSLESGGRSNLVATG